MRIKTLSLVRIILITLFIVTFAQAADNVVVIPLGGTNVYIDPRNIISRYHYWGPDSSTATILSVPSGSHFVLTDVIGEADVEILENETTKMRVRVGGISVSASGRTAYPNPITISSGIVFSPGTNVRATPDDSLGTPDYFGYITLSGYFY